MTHYRDELLAVLCEKFDGIYQCETEDGSEDALDAIKQIALGIEKSLHELAQEIQEMEGQEHDA